MNRIKKESCEQRVLKNSHQKDAVLYSLGMLIEKYQLYSSKRLGDVLGNREEADNFYCTFQSMSVLELTKVIAKIITKINMYKNMDNEYAQKTEDK